MSAAPAADASTTDASVPPNEYLNLIVIPFFTFTGKPLKSDVTE
jgi:hypothetical protein